MKGKGKEDLISPEKRGRNESKICIYGYRKHAQFIKLTKFDPSKSNYETEISLTTTNLSYSYSVIISDPYEEIRKKN